LNTASFFRTRCSWAGVDQSLGDDPGHQREDETELADGVCEALVAGIATGWGVPNRDGVA
jgi:hypothetical protein